MELDPGVQEDDIGVIFSRFSPLNFFSFLSTYLGEFTVSIFFTGRATGSKTKVMELDPGVQENVNGIICLSFFLFISLYLDDFTVSYFFTGGATGSKTKLLEPDSGVQEEGIGVIGAISLLSNLRFLEEETPIKKNQIRKACPNFGHPTSISSFTKYKILNCLSVLKLFQLSNGDLLLSYLAYSIYTKCVNLKLRS